MHVSLEALRRLKLDAVWWLVSPQNPLKSEVDMASYDQRVASAEAMTGNHPRIHVSRFEQREGTRYTVDTLAHLQQRYPHTRFIWLMGADNLQQMHRWRRWQRIMQRVPVAVFDRAPFSHAALRSKAALAFRAFRRPEMQLTRASAPAWSYIFMRRHPESASQLRNLLGKGTFLRHN